MDDDAAHWPRLAPFRGKGDRTGLERAPPPAMGRSSWGNPRSPIRHSDEFEDPGLVSAIEVTVTLRAVVCGTELDIVQEGIPDVIPVAMCHLGWQESLAHLVEPDIQG